VRARQPVRSFVAHLLTRGRNGEILSTGFCVADFVSEPERINAYAHRLRKIRAGAEKFVQNIGNSLGPAPT
jgi:hypothetical protein